MSWSKKPVVLQPLIHWGPAWICYLGLIRISLRQKFQNGLSINLLQNDFKHNKYNKEECHKPYICHLATITTKLISLSHRLSRTEDYTTSRWWPIEFPMKTFLACISLYLLISSHMWRLKGRRKRENREKNKERLIPSWGTTIKTLCQPGYLPKALLPNTITLGVKGGNNSIHSSYADLFLNQDRHSFYSLLLLIHVSWCILGTK